MGALSSGGAQRVATSLANYWADQGHNVSLICTYSGRGENVFWLDSRVRLLFLADLAETAPPFLFGKLRRAYALRRLIVNFPSARIISFLTHVNVLAIFALWKLPNPLIVSERIYPPRMPTPKYLRKMRQWLYSHADLVVMQTVAGQRWLSGEIPKANGAVITNPVVIPLPSGTPVVRPERIVKANDKLVLAAGRLVVQKGFDRLITAFGKLSIDYPGWHLVIAGEGELRDQLESQINALGIAEYVHLPGDIGNMADWYERADIFVLSSRFEGFPNALLEAMVYGCACISYACQTGPDEIISNGTTGVLVNDADDGEKLADALRHLMLDDRLRSQLGEAARKVTARYKIECIAAQWLQRFEEAVYE